MDKQKCYKCKETKPISDFYKDKTKKSGYGFICKECKKIQMQGFSKKHYQKNKKEVLERNKKWRQKNPEKYREITRRYYKNNKEKALESAEKLRQKKMSWFWDKAGPFCRQCGYNKSTVALEIHHLRPTQKENGKDNFSRWVRKLSFENFKKKVIEHDYIILCSNCHTELHAGIWQLEENPFNCCFIFETSKDEIEEYV